MKLFNTLCDGPSLRGRIGVDIETFEMLEIVQTSEQIPEEDVEEIVCRIQKSWRFTSPADGATLQKGARYYLALARKVRERGFKAVSLIDVDGMKKLLGFPPSMIFMLLSDLVGVSTIPENDALGAVTQIMVQYLTGQIGVYMEFYEFMQDRVLIGVPDFVPGEVVDGPVTVTPTAFGGLSEGVLNVSKVKTGRLTLCRLASTGDRYVMHRLTGEALTPRPWEEAGWEPPAPQLPSLEVVLDVPIDEFASKVFGQHYIIAYGEHVELIDDLCRILGIEVI